jgi:peptidoglycan/xylan/chitin deacetylase (PgdA/CDA1 family)
MFVVLTLFPVILGKDQTVVQVKGTKPITDSKPEPAQEPVAATTVPSLAPDYSIPPTTDGMVPVIYKLPTDQKVVFLGLDDGTFKDQSVVDLMAKNNIKASLFLSQNTISNNPDFFKQLIDQGSVVENHTINHDTKMITTENYDQQKSEICGMSDYAESHFGRRPTLFRPPGGAYSDSLRQAAADCGMKAIVTWVAKVNGGSMQYQIGDKLRAGDIVLMHFRPEFASDMKAFVDAMNASGLHTALLEDAI